MTCVQLTRGDKSFPLKSPYGHVALVTIGQTDPALTDLRNAIKTEDVIYSGIIALWC